MSLLDSIHSKCVGSAMSGSWALAGFTQETLEVVGISLPQIRDKALAAAASATAEEIVVDPLIQMQIYAMFDVDESVQAAIKNAATNADNVVDATFTTSLSGFGQSLFQIQNAVGEALAAGVSSFGDSLCFICPDDIDVTLNFGNATIPAARGMYDALIEKAFIAANKSIYAQVNEIHDRLATAVQEQNAHIEANQ